jgi:nucleoside-diphosphate-sugar epimerase
MPSLQVTWIRNTILNALRISTKASLHVVPFSFVYHHPSIHALATFVYEVVSGQVALVDTDAVISAKVKAMHTMVEKYSTKIGSLGRPRTVDATHTRNVVVLTGTTGRLGSHLLAQLLQDDAVERVYALNRQSASGINALITRQKEAFGEWDLDPAMLVGDKLTMVVCEYSSDRLGLDGPVYEKVWALAHLALCRLIFVQKIASTVTSIIHCGALTCPFIFSSLTTQHCLSTAWRVDFNVGLLAFEPLIAGLVSILDLAAQSPSTGGARVLFVSSVAVLTSRYRCWTHAHCGCLLRILDQPQGELAEEKADIDPRISASSGYGESKWVAEQLLLTARRERGLRATSVRVGQLSGDSRAGAWYSKEWVPALVSLGKSLNALPSRSEVSLRTPTPAHRYAAQCLQLPARYVGLGRRCGNGTH